MLQFRPEQVSALAESSRQRMVAGVGERYAEAVRSRGVGAHTARQQFGVLLARAAQRGLQSQRSLDLYAQLAVSFGPFFDERPSVAEVLARHAAEADSLFLEIVDAVPPATWMYLPDAAWTHAWQRAFGAAEGDADEDGETSLF